MGEWKMEVMEQQALNAEHSFAMITELIEIGVPVEKLHQQGITDFDFEYVEMHPEDGLWSDPFD
jgi:hypothetical protein